MNSVESLFRVPPVLSSGFFKVSADGEPGKDASNSSQGFIESFGDNENSVISLYDVIAHELGDSNDKTLDIIADILEGEEISTEQENNIISIIGDAIKVISNNVDRMDDSSEAALSNLNDAYIKLIGSIGLGESHDMRPGLTMDVYVKQHAMASEKDSASRGGGEVFDIMKAMDSLKEKMSDYYREPMDFIRRQNDSVPSGLTTPLFSMENTLSSIARAFVDAFNTYQIQGMEPGNSVIARSDMPTAESINKNLLTEKIFEKVKEFIKDIGRGPGGAFNIKVHPQYLGEVSVSIVHGKDGVSISIDASEDIASMIRADLGNMSEGNEGSENKKVAVNGKVIGEDDENVAHEVEVKINNESTSNLLKLIL